MAFIQRDAEARTTQQLFLLRSGHDLELECRTADWQGHVINRPVNRLAYTLDDKQAIQLDRHVRNSVESYDAWRKVIESILNNGVIRDGWYVPTHAQLVGLVTIAAFGEPVWELEENLSVVDHNMLALIHSEKR